MEISWAFLSFILGTISVIQANEKFESMNKDYTEEYRDGILCSLTSAKRMLREIGIASSSKCLLNSKRDIANLVTTYLKMGSTARDDSNTSNFQREGRKILLKLQDFLEDELTRSKRAYCCSPKCDPFMKTLGNPDKNLITCDKKK